MEQYSIGRATVRIQGKCDPDKLHNATLQFLRKTELKRKKDMNDGKRIGNHQGK